MVYVSIFRIRFLYIRLRVANENHMKLSKQHVHVIDVYGIHKFNVPSQNHEKNILMQTTWIT